MRRVLIPIFASIILTLFFPDFGFAASPATLPSQPAAATPHSSIVLPPGSKIEMALTRPVWAKTSAPGDTLYAVTVFPVTHGSHMAIPAGSYVEGTIESLTKPTRKLQRSVLQVVFDKLIFSNGYTITLSVAGSVSSSPTLTDVTVQVSTANDLLLDNGSQITLTLQTPLSLSATEIAQAIPLSHAPNPNDFATATLCRYIPGTPGTSGTPGTFIPGTPSTVIPGGPGMPDTVIPGTPSTDIPGTPGTPGSPDIACPAPPLVLSSTPAISPP